MLKDPITPWDAFAAAALMGLHANPEAGCQSPRDYAHWAAQVADSMMKERALRAPVDVPF